jgi:hypothetical protein
VRTRTLVMVFGLPYEVLGIASRGASSEQCGGSFTWQSYPPSMRLAQLYRYGVTRKAALAAFLAFAVEARMMLDVSRTETKYRS